MKIFLDASILFSAAKSDGPVRQLLALLLEAGHERWADAYVAEEARRNLAAKAPESLSALTALLGCLRLAGAPPHPYRHPALAPLPEKDRPVLAAAIELGCDTLVTGDRTHFGALHGKRLGGVRVLSPRLLADELPGTTR